MKTTHTPFALALRASLGTVRGRYGAGRIPVARAAQSLGMPIGTLLNWIGSRCVPHVIIQRDVLERLTTLTAQSKNAETK